MINLDQILALAIAAGDEILSVYNSDDFEAETKGDGSPLTLADRRAHLCIAAGLQQLTPDIPLLSEESDDSAFADRRNWQRYWLVDPLDGTREFVKRNGEFTVNIALIDNQEPVLGVVHTPVTGINYIADSTGVWRTDSSLVRESISVRPRDPAQTIMVASRSHAGSAVQQYQQNLEQQVGAVSVTSMGSSLKICLVAEGKADIYPRLGPTSEWDTAAAHCVLVAAGGQMVETNGDSLGYNKENLLNPWFLACGDPNFDWIGAAAGIEEPN